MTSRRFIKSYRMDDSTIKHNPMGGIDYSLVINDTKNYTMNMGIVLSQGSIGHMIGSGSPSVELMVKLHDVYGDSATPQVREWVKSEIEDDGPKWREKFIIPGLMIFSTK